MKSTLQAFITDREAVRRYLDDGDVDSFQLLHDRYAGKVYRTCISLLDEASLAEDATQEIFIRVFLNFPRFRREASFSSWLFTISRNYCFDFIKGRKREEKIFRPITDNLTCQPEEDPAASPSLEQRMTELEKILRTIPEEDSKILRMKFEQQMSIKAIAGVFQTSESAVKMRIMRSKAKARRRYAQMAG